MSSIDSYESYVDSKATVEFKGGYVVVTIRGWDERSCSCHPETCNHFDGKVKVHWEQKDSLPLRKN